MNLFLTTEKCLELEALLTQLVRKLDKPIVNQFIAAMDSESSLVHEIDGHLIGINTDEQPSYRTLAKVKIWRLLERKV